MPPAEQTFGYPSDALRMLFGVLHYLLTTILKLPCAGHALHKVPVGEPARLDSPTVQKLRGSGKWALSSRGIVLSQVPGNRMFMTSRDGVARALPY